MKTSRGPIAGALDIGSNTLKMLVVEKTADGLVALAETSNETRISAGISGQHPELTEQSMSRAVTVIGELYREMHSHNPDHVRVVATSAVRDARNQADFRERVYQEIGQTMDVISGVQEAQLIGRGVLTDPVLRGKREIMIFDMGGGSVECIYVKDGSIKLAESLLLGGVSLLEHHVADPSRPLQAIERAAVIESVKSQVSRLDLKLEDASTAWVVGAGGTWITSRAIIAHRQGKTLAESSPYLNIKELQSVFEETASYTLNRRLQIPKLPPNRADVFPVTLLTLIELGKWVGVSQFYHCFHSLRYGVVDELLESY